MTNQNPNALANPENKLKSFMRSDAIMERFEEVLGERGARSYVSSVLLTVANNDALHQCTPASIVASALRAATLSLSCDPSIGQAYLVPYGKVATFVVGYKGLRDMALRTNKYRYIHVDKVYAGEGVDIDRITGSARMIGAKENNEIVGWVASFQMVNGFSKTIYMSREEIHEHAKKYSKGYERQGGVWKQNPAMMEKKTVLRQLLTHWGVLDSRDQLFLSQLDAAETAELETIEANFIQVPTPREDVNEDDVLSDLGFSGTDNQQGNAVIIETDAGQFTGNQGHRFDLDLDYQDSDFDPRELDGEFDEEVDAEEIPLRYDPIALRSALITSANKHGSKNPIVSQQDRNMLAVNLETCFAGETDSKEKRKTITHFFFGVDSTKDLDSGQVVSLKRWLNVTKDSGGEWHPDPMAIREAHAVYVQALKDEGQTELPL